MGFLRTLSEASSSGEGSRAHPSPWGFHWPVPPAATPPLVFLPNPTASGATLQPCSVSECINPVTGTLCSNSWLGGSRWCFWNILSHSVGLDTIRTSWVPPGTLDQHRPVPVTRVHPVFMVSNKRQGLWDLQLPGLVAHMKPRDLGQARVWAGTPHAPGPGARDVAVRAQ